MVLHRMHKLIHNLMKEIQSMLGVKDPRTARKYVHRLIEAGQMSMTMPEVPNHPDQKYLAIK